jgi:hypothetical protein
MQTDPIIEETRRLRREYAEQFGFDLRAIAADLREGEGRHPERLVSFAPKPGRKKKTA